MKKGRCLSAPPFLFETETRLRSVPILVDSSFFGGFVLNVGFDFSSSCVSFGSHFFGTGFKVGSSFFSTGFESFCIGFSVCSHAVSGVASCVFGSFRASGERESGGRSGSDECDLAHNVIP